MPPAVAVAPIAPLVFSAVGNPAPQGSKKRGDHGQIIESSKQVRPWRALITDAVLEVLKAEGRGMPFGRKVSVVVTATFFRRPTVEAQRLHDRGVETVPATRPDGDKELRALFDALSGVAYHDDAQVGEFHVYRRWAFDRPHGVDVTVSLWEPASG